MQIPPDIIIKTFRPGFIEFDTAIIIKGMAPNLPVAPPNTNLPGNNSIIDPRHAIATYSQMIDTHRASIEQQFQSLLQALPQTIENELATTRLEGTTHTLPPVEAINREIAVRNKLLARKNTEFHEKIIIANLFYGSDPTSKSIGEFYVKAAHMEVNVDRNSVAIQAWLTSYQAAYDSRIVLHTIQILNQQAITVQNFLNAVQANEIAAEQEAQRVAAEQARLAAEAAAQQAAAEQARLADLEEARLAAAEQSRLAAEAAAQQAAAEQARLAALEEARQAAAEQARAAAAAEAAAEQARLGALAELKRLEDLHKDQVLAKTSIHTVAGSTAASGPMFTGTAGTLLVSQATSIAIRAALQSALSAAISGAITSAGAVVGGFAALVYPSQLGNSDLHALSVPLADLAPGTDQDLRASTQTSGQVPLHVGIGSRTNGNSIEYFVVATNGTTPHEVPVQLATYDPVRNIYTAQSPDVPSIGMNWTPIVKPGDASTSLPQSEPGIVVYEGVTVTALEGRIDYFPAHDLDSLGGFITVFPADSGIPPIFTMFRDRRNEPGTVGGFGQSISGDWIDKASTQEGAPIPAQIADKLRGREFSSFKALRRAIWQGFANDENLLNQFSPFGRTEIKQYLSPKARSSEHVGRRTKLEIHHVQPISEGGAVYDIDNLRLLTPKQHIKIHSERKGSQ